MASFAGVQPQFGYVPPQTQFQGYPQQGPWNGFPQQFPGYPQFPGWGQSQRPTLTPKDDYLARLASHDNQLNGANQRYGPDGTIYYQTVLNPANGQAATFLNTPERVQWFKDAIQTDLRMNGRLDGDVLRDAIRKSYYAATGANIPQIMNLPLPGPDLRQQTIYKAAADPTKPGGLQGLSQASGLSPTQLGIYALWGHDASINKQITNPNTRTFLQDALTNPQSRDYPLLQAAPEFKAYAQSVLQSQTPGDKINQDFLNTLESVFHSPGLLQNVHQPQQPGGWPPQHFPGGGSPYGQAPFYQQGFQPPYQQNFTQPGQPRFWG